MAASKEEEVEIHAEEESSETEGNATPESDTLDKLTQKQTVDTDEEWERMEREQRETEAALRAARKEKRRLELRQRQKEMEAALARQTCENAEIARQLDLPDDPGITGAVSPAKKQRTTKPKTGKKQTATSLSKIAAKVQATVENDEDTQQINREAKFLADDFSKDWRDETFTEVNSLNRLRKLGVISDKDPLPQAKAKSKRKTSRRDDTDSDSDENTTTSGESSDSTITPEKVKTQKKGKKHVDLSGIYDKPGAIIRVLVLIPTLNILSRSKIRILRLVFFQEGQTERNRKFSTDFCGTRPHSAACGDHGAAIFRSNQPTQLSPSSVETTQNQAVERNFAHPSPF